MNRLSGIVSFVEAAESGSFAAAAQRMGLSRSAIAKSIARLEQRLGAVLFHRTTRTQTLTEAGQVFYERCVRAIAEIDAAEAVLDSGKSAPVGCLRVSVPVLFGRSCVAPVLLDLALEFPQLRLEMSFTDRVVDLIEDHVDLAVRIGSLEDRAGIIARRLGSMSMVVCAAPGYLATRGTPTKADELRQHDILAYGRTASTLRWSLRDKGGLHQEVSVDSRIAFDDLESIANAVVAGAGIARLPSWLIAARMHTGQLTALFEDPKRLDIYAVWPQTRHLPIKARVAVDALVKRIPIMTEFG